MDIHGRNPRNEMRRVFRVNIHGWKPIYALICQLCHDLVDEETLRGMSFNGDWGPKSGEVCRQMADRFAAWFERNPSESHVDADLEEEVDRIIASGSFAHMTESDLRALVKAYGGLLRKKWVDFLRNCGGFAVW